MSVPGGTAQPTGNAASGIGTVTRFSANINRGLLNTGDGTSKSLSVSLTSYPKAGNLLLVSIKRGSQSTDTLLSIKDGFGNVYTQTAQSPFIDVPNTVVVWLAYILSAPANADKTITATWSDAPATNSVNLFAEEFPVYGTPATFDSSAYGSGSGTAVNAPNINAAAAGELQYSNDAVGGQTTATNAPWTSCGANSSNGDTDAYILSSSSGNTAVNFTQNNAVVFSAWGASFK